MNMQVIFTDNSPGEIDSMDFDRMLADHKIMKFMRDDGWAQVGIDRMRGDGGKFNGADRRGMYGLTREMLYHFIS